MSGRETLHPGAGGRTCRRRGSGLLTCRYAPARRRGLFRRGVALGRGAPVQAAARLKEAAKPGFARAVLPQSAAGEGGGELGLALTPVPSLSHLAADIAAT